ncbi:MAG: PadR family transcriptional regulator [Chloroflexi bacterium]|nr:PadR family transcriptional regulator [Chloroflexota bacterium]
MARQHLIRAILSKEGSWPLPNRSPLDPLPLPVAQLHILLALVTGDKHGYAIMREVEALTDGAVTMGPGTLYGAVKKMLKSELVEESDERPDPELDDQRRRYYRITAFGKRVLDAEINRMEQLAHAARLIQTTAMRRPSA